ncbi:MAG TPA: metallophosphoesterase family protein [Bacteroidota bacterium]
MKNTDRLHDPEITIARQPQHQLTLTMRFAIISDLHSNLEALQKALELIDQESVQEIVCLGDIVGYGADPNECVNLVRSRCRIVLRGNHDAAAVNPLNAESFTRNARIAAEWTRQQLSPENRRYLEGLPYTASRDGILFVHASPYQPESWFYVLSEEDLESAFQNFSEQLCFIGHSHFPGIFSEEGPAKTVSRGLRYLINVGSIGQPRDGNAKLSFGIFDTERWEYRNIRSEYPIQIAAEKIIRAGLPRALADRLPLGM